MKQKLPTKKRFNLSKGVIIAGVSVLLLGSSVSAYFLTRPDATPKTTSPTEETVNYEPATEAEKKESEANKDRIVEEQNSQTPATPAGQKKAVTPTITNANQGNVSAYVTGIFEENGTCTATFTRAGVTKTKTSVGFQNVSYTQCAPLTMESGFLSAGTWSVTVGYESATASGVSAAKSIEVQ